MKHPKKKVFFVAALFIMLAAIFSEGFYHLDEHYQILEFASYKLGISGYEDMPWEFREHMRPTVQPWIAYFTHQLLGFLGNENPLLVAMTLRVFSGILALITVIAMFKTFGRHYKGKNHIILFGVTLLLWFNPYLFVRFSSENWGGMLFFIATAILLKNKPIKGNYLWLAGAMLGISFFIRFQMAFAILGLVGYLVYYKRTSTKGLIKIAISGFFAICFMVLLDYLYYEKLVFTPWEYFKHNILLEKAASFGVEPWWMYFGWLIEEALLPVALPIIYGLYQLLKNKELSVLNWIWIPFALGHFFVGHKELRFLFPMVYLVPYAIVEAWQKITIHLRTDIILVKVALVAILSWNFGLFVYTSVTPAKSFVKMYSEIAKNVEPNAVVYLASQKNEEWNYPLKYYLNPSINIIRADSNVSLVKVDNRPHYVWIKKSENQLSQKFVGDSVTATIPQWLYLFDFNGWVGREKNFVLYQLK